MIVRNTEIEMPPCRHSSRINTLELKAHIIRKLGNQKAEKYFHNLNRLLSLKLSKSEFDKLCIITIGRENVSLHNQLISAIIKNACLAKTPPSKRSKTEVNVKVENGYHRSNLQSLCGDLFPPSPRKGRSSNFRDRRFRDRPRPLEPHGKIQSIVCDGSTPRTQEHQSATELASLGSRPVGEVVSVEDGEEVEQVTDSPNVQSRSPIRAPLGISINVAGSCKAVRRRFLSAFDPETCRNSHELPDTQSLKKRLEGKLQEMEGLGISMDCANLLNNGLDAFLKRLIRPDMELVRSRCGHEHIKQVNGVWPEKDIRGSVQSISGSLLDFRVAMEMNPQLLGKDWSSQLERISLCTSEK